METGEPRRGTCAQCGSPLTATGLARGACLRCLLELAAADEPLPDAEEAAGPGETVGSRIGPYEILERLGVGGMGVVYLARQTGPLPRQVAVKLIKLGMDTREVLARFDSERRALALMSHPHIARVHDAGVAPDGRPYFVMDPVFGEPITAFCDGRRLPLPARLALFLQACDAIQHAHEKGIIHRDIKPSNVLVSSADGGPTATVIDFGIAKAIQADPLQASQMTRQGALIGTPEYMSPEQVASDGQDVDTRTDVYALGMLLYELLAGVSPLEAPDGRRAPLEDLRRRILSEELVRPSVRLAAAGAGAAAVAERRGTDSLALRRALRGELDWIVMKALDRDRGRRYASPRELAADLERHVRHEPVSAGPPGAAYRLRKFARRHRLGVATTAGILFVLLATAGALGVQARRIAKERDRANREASTARHVSEFLTGLFEVSDPGEARGNQVSAREILDRGAERIDRELADQPVQRARLMAVMGGVYARLGLHHEAEPLLRDARATLGAALGPDDPDTLRADLELASLLYAEQQLPEAESILRGTLGLARKRLGDSDPLTLAALGDLAVTVQFQGRFDEAAPLYAETLAGRRRVLGPEHPDTLETVNNVASMHMARGRLDEAEPYAREALAGRQHALGPDHPETLDSLVNLGTVLLFTGRPAEAEPPLREAVERGERLRPDHHNTIVSRNNLGRSLAEQGRLEEADAELRAALAGFRRTLGDDHPQTLTALGNLGDLCTSRGALPEAESLLTSAAAGARRVLPAGHVVTATIVRKQGRLWAALGRYDEAEALLLGAERDLRAGTGPGHPFTRKAVEDLAALYEARGRADEAARWRARLSPGAP